MDTRRVVDGETFGFSLNGDRPTFEDLGPGSIVADYVIERFVARGGYGCVYEARRKGLPERVAIKVLHAMFVGSRLMTARFAREVDIVKRLHHPNIVQILECATLPDGRPFYVMEYLEGTTLSALLERRGRLLPEEVLAILRPVCSALGSAHKAGIVHRDVKASNIVVLPENAACSIKLLDFGIAKLLEPQHPSAGLTSAGQQVGTPTAMSPEQIRGEPIDARTDIYALGVLLYRLLTGKLPFASSDLIEVVRMHLDAPPPRPSRIVPVSFAIDAIVLKCMEKLPTQRFSSMENFLAALEDAIPEARRTAKESRVEDTSRQVIGICFDAHAEIAGAEDLDDELATDIGGLLDVAEIRLRQEGYSVALSVGHRVLFVRPLALSPEDALRERRSALKRACSMYDDLKQRTGADARVRMAIALHVDAAIFQEEDGRTKVKGGSVVNTSAWAPPQGGEGVYATPRMLEGLAGPFCAEPIRAEPSGALLYLVDLTGES